jgi:hypothetical protein
MLKSHGTNFLDYNSQIPENFKQNSVLTSHYTQSGVTKDFMNRASTLAVGVKVRLGFNLCSNKPVERTPVYDTRPKEEKEEKQPEKPVPVFPILRKIFWTLPGWKRTLSRFRTFLTCSGKRSKAT